MSKIIELNPRIIDINAAGNRLGYLGAKHLAAEGLQQRPGLISINLSDNNIGNKGIEYIATILKQYHNIKSVNLSHNNITDGIVFCKEILENNKEITLFDLRNNKISNKGIELLVKEGFAKTPNLSSFLLGNNEISNNGAKALENIFKHCPVIVEFNMMTNNIGYKGIESLTKAFQAKECNIISLNLSSNPIEDKGIKVLTEGLRDNDKIVSLNLSGTKISDKGALYISKWLKLNNNNINSLEISWNDITDDGAKDLFKAIINKAKMYFNLSSNKITDVGINDLVDIVEAKPNKAVSINLDHNNISNQGALKIAKAIVEHQSQYKVSLAENEMVTLWDLIKQMLDSVVTEHNDVYLPVLGCVLAVKESLDDHADFNTPINHVKWDLHM